MVYVPTAVSSLLALLPLLPPEAISIIPSVVLLLQGGSREGFAAASAAAAAEEPWGAWLAAPHRLAALGVLGANASVTSPKP